MGVVSGPAAQARFVQETGVAATIAALAEPVLEGLGFRLVRVRIMGGQDTIVEIMAERPDGSMTVEDCRSVSVNLSPLLDVHEPLPGSYRLQISSPGIDRPLVRPSDFEHWAGYTTKIELKEPVGGRKRFRGTLEGYEDEEVRIAVDLDKDGQQVLGFPIGLIADARLVLTDDLIRESLRRAKKNEAETSTNEAETSTAVKPAGSARQVS
jgi:ribosome maturation factor RimP